MKCDLEFCIYNNGNSCILDEVYINGFGMCEDCILVSVPPKALECLKREQLRDIESRQK